MTRPMALPVTLPMALGANLVNRDKIASGGRSVAYGLTTKTGRMGKIYGLASSVVALGENGRMAQDLNSLMIRIRDQRDRAAFSDLFDEMAPRLKGFLMVRSQTPEVAEDILQNVFLKVWRRAATFDPAKASAATWIYTIARNARIDMLRKEGKPSLDPHEPSLHPTAEIAADEICTQKQDQTLLAEAIKALPPEQAELIGLAFYEDLSHSEIAVRQSLPMGTVKSRLRLAIGKLRRALAIEPAAAQEAGREGEQKT